MFREKQKGTQIRANGAQSEADGRLMRRPPGADSSPIMAAQVRGSSLRPGDDGSVTVEAESVQRGGAGGGRDDGWLFARDLSGTTEMNECVLLL